MFTVQTEWDCPDSFPDLSGEKYIAIDLETKDPDLKAKGAEAPFHVAKTEEIRTILDNWDRCSASRRGMNRII